MKPCRWNLCKENTALIQRIENQYQLPAVAAKVFAARAQSSRSLDYLHTADLESPFVLKDMNKAIDRINKAILQNEKIAVYGDYDCDGITSATMLTNYLLGAGADVTAYIPERAVGYGMHTEAINELKSRGVSLIITVDNGITAYQEADYIYQSGMELIITDHHAVSDTLPRAEAIINPKQNDCPSAFKELAGAGVVFKLIAALQGGDYQIAFELCGDLACIGTVGDVMPLIGENRTIVQKGLQQMPYTENLGIYKLAQTTHLSLQNITAKQVAFILVPRLNVAGRLGHAKQAFALLNAEEETEAEKLAMQLDQEVHQRQSIEENIMKEIMLQIHKDSSLIHQRILVFAGNWPAGLIGIISGKLLKIFGKPSIVFSVQEETAHGSARSFDSFSIYEAIKSVSSLCENWGGHTAAAGVTLLCKNIDIFRKKINDYAKKRCPVPPAYELQIDAEIHPKDFTLDLYDALQIMEPFGHANPIPVFLIRKVNIIKKISLSGGKHTKLLLKKENNVFESVLFSTAPNEIYFTKDHSLDIIGTIHKNIYHGKESVSFHITDMRPASFAQEEMIQTYDMFEQILSSGLSLMKNKDAWQPNRSKFVFVYQFLHKLNAPFYNSQEQLYFFLKSSGLLYSELLMITEIFKRTGILDMDPFGKKIKLNSVSHKVDLTKCDLYQQFIN